MVDKHEMMIRGIPASPGIAIGWAAVIVPESIIVPEERISQSAINDEIARFESALNNVVYEFNSILGRVRKEPQNVYAVLETNLVLISDPFIIDSIKNKIREGFSAESAIIREFDHQKQFLAMSRDAIIRERVIELDQIKERLLGALRNFTNFFSVEPGSIVCAQSLSTTDMINCNDQKIKAIVTEVGGISSHSSILARSFEIPAVIGLKNLLMFVDQDTDLIVDGYSGVVIINPSAETVFAYRQKLERQAEHKALLGDLVKLESVTTDGKSVKLMANVDFPEDIEHAIIAGADGVGLVRSEHLIISLGHFPHEEEQFKWYSDIADRAYPKIVTIRAFDLGSDKYAEGIPKHESNPALGFRGIRFLLQRRDIFETQIRAVLRASKHKNVRFMLPMISTIDEVKTARQIIEICKITLLSEGFMYDEQLPVGVMIETPAAVMIADGLAENAEFFSIGTNDLTQYTIAADRTNEMVNELFDSFHPAVLRMIKLTIEAAKVRKISCSICGEFAGHVAATELLIGLGIDELSVTPAQLLELKNRVRNTENASAVLLAEKALQCYAQNEVHKLIATN